MDPSQYHYQTLGANMGEYGAYSAGVQQQQQQQQQYAACYSGRPVAPKPSPRAPKRKRAKDPNKPKRPTSAYFYFVAAQRLECKAAGKDISRVAEWTKEISAVWRALTDQEKIPYNIQAAADKKRYDSAMDIYKGRDKDKPKKAPSSYFCFLEEFRKKKAGQLDHKEILRAAGEVWRSMSDQDKAPFERVADERKKVYEKAMAVYNENKNKKARMDAAAAGDMAMQAKNGGQQEILDEDDDDEYEDDDE